MKVIGHDDQGEPIWELTGDEEWGQQFAPGAQATAKAEAQTQGGSAPQGGAPSTEMPEPAPGEAAAQREQAMELGAQIWEWRKKGVSRYEIHRRLSIPMEAVDEILQQFERRFYPDVGRALHHYASLDDQRLEDLIHRWLPVATGPAPEIEKVDRRGRTYTELDTDTPPKAAAIVLGAIKSRIQLLMACRPENAGGKDGGGQTNLLVWLTQVLPGVQKIVRQVDGDGELGERKRQSLVLECEAEDISSNGSNR